MGNATSSVQAPPKGGAAEESLKKEFAAGKDGVYRQQQGEVLYLTDKRAKPHRCNDRLEDVIQALFEGNPLLTVPPAFNMFQKCLASDAGKEPEDPYLFLDLPPPIRKPPQPEKKKGWFS